MAFIGVLDDINKLRQTHSTFFMQLHGIEEQPVSIVREEGESHGADDADADERPLDEGRKAKGRFGRSNTGFTVDLSVNKYHAKRLASAGGANSPRNASTVSAAARQQGPQPGQGHASTNASASGSQRASEQGGTVDGEWRDILPGNKTIDMLLDGVARVSALEERETQPVGRGGYTSMPASPRNAVPQGPGSMPSPRDPANTQPPAIPARVLSGEDPGSIGSSNSNSTSVLKPTMMTPKPSLSNSDAGSILSPRTSLQEREKSSANSILPRRTSLEDREKSSACSILSPHTSARAQRKSTSCSHSPRVSYGDYHKDSGSSGVSPRLCTPVDLASPRLYLLGRDHSSSSSNPAPPMGVHYRRTQRVSSASAQAARSASTDQPPSGMSSSPRVLRVKIPDLPSPSSSFIDEEIDNQELAITSPRPSLTSPVPILKLPGRNHSSSTASPDESHKLLSPGYKQLVSPSSTSAGMPSPNGDTPFSRNGDPTASRRGPTSSASFRLAPNSPNPSRLAASSSAFDAIHEEEDDDGPYDEKSLAMRVNFGTSKNRSSLGGSSPGPRPSAFGALGRPLDPKVASALAAVTQKLQSDDFFQRELSRGNAGVLSKDDFITLKTGVGTPGGGMGLLTSSLPDCSIRLAKSTYDFALGKATV
eukprot:gene244-4009_t